MNRSLFAVVICLLGAQVAAGQAENPDYRIKAEFRDTAGESVGNANFRIKSRFMQVYYGGVSRRDEYRFQIELDSPAFANQSFNVFLNDVPIADIAANSAGFFDQTFRSDFKPDDAPDLPLPAVFPDFVDVGDVVTVYDAVTHALQLTSTFGEELARGDTDADGDVDDDDLTSWRSSYGGPGTGPANGDYTGDNRADGDDFLTWQRNLSAPSQTATPAAAAVPEPGGLLLITLAIAAAVVRRR